MNLDTLIARLPGAYSLYAKNLSTGKILAYDERAVIPSASLIKVPILAELYRRCEEEGLHLDETVTMRREDQIPGSGVLQDLTPGTPYLLRDLATLMITVSDNTATNLLIDFLGIDAVNAVIRRLGLMQTALERTLERVPVERPRVNRTTAYDMTRLMELIAQGQCLSVNISRRMVDLLERCQAPCSLAPTMPEPSFVGEPWKVQAAHKTGSLSQSRHDSGIVYAPFGVLAVTIMSHGAPASALQKPIDRIGRLVYQQLRS